MIRVLLLMAGAAALVYTGVIYNSEAIIILAFCACGLAVISYLYAVYIMFQVKCQVQIPISIAEQGEPAWVEAVTRNNSRLPAVRIRYIIKYGNVLSDRRRSMKVLTGAGARETSRLSTELNCEQGGCYVFRLKRIRIYGWFGIGYVSRRVRSEAVLHVMPEIVPLNLVVGEASRHFMGEADIHDDKIGGDDATEIFQIRPFRDGDKLCSIHWKLSAKEEELMVRENSLPLGGPVILLLDMRREPRRSVRKGRWLRPSTEHRMAQFYGTVLSLSFALMEQRCIHYIAWYSQREQDIVRVRVDKEEKVYLALLLLYGSLRDTGGGQEQDIRQLYQDKYKGETWITEILLSIYGSVQLNGETVTEELSKTELRV